MQIFKFKKTKDGQLVLQMKARDLCGVVGTLGSAVPINEMIFDDEYVVRLSQDGKIELGYLTDKWEIE